ncbi:MAG TPA: hypothetical protein VGF91_15245, partial [Solirubrobacteraceae bacterium]
MSGDGTQLQDVSVPTLVECVPSFSDGLADHIQFASIPISASGSFTATATQTGVIDNSPATFTYIFSGQFTGAHAIGSLQEGVAFNNGTAYSCTTRPQTWSATRDTQGTQAVSPSPGSYTVTSLQERAGVSSLYVSGDGTQLQDVSV